MDLRGFDLFKGLHAEQLNVISQSVRQRQLERREVVCSKGDIPEGLYLLFSGQLQVFDITADGREVGLNLIKPGAYFGELSVIDNLPRSAHIVALEPSLMGVLPQETARKLFYQVPEIAEAMMKHLTGTVRSMSRHRLLLGIPNASQRVFALLEQMSKPVPGGLIVVQNVPRQQEMAIMLNTSRETVSRAVAELVRTGVIQKDWRRLIVRMPDALRQLAHGSEEPQS